MVERRIPQFNLEPKSQQGQKPKLRPAQRDFEQEARSPLDEARFKFLVEAMDKKVHLIKPQGVSKKVFHRQFDIVERLILGRESKESVGQGYGKPINWVDIELRQGLDRLWSYSPEQLRTEIPRETILPSKSKSNRLKREAGEEDLASQLQREDLNKEQLWEIKPKIGERFYRGHKELFMRLRKLIKKSGLLPTTPADLVAAVLEQEGGVVVFSYHGKKEDKRGVKTCYLVLIHDVDPSVDTLKSSERLKDYQGGY